MSVCTRTKTNRAFKRGSSAPPHRGRGDKHLLAVARHLIDEGQAIAGEEVVRELLHAADGFDEFIVRVLSLQFVVPRPRVDVE